LQNLAGCSAELSRHSGGANPYSALSANLSSTLKLPRKIALKATFGASWSFNYSGALAIESISFSGPEAVAHRTVLFSNLGISGRPFSALGVAFGLSTAHAQIGADGRYRTPFFNRYSKLYLDLSARY
jgi:hypothetical protein